MSTVLDVDPARLAHAQSRAVAWRVEEVDELRALVDLLADRPDSVPDLLRVLSLTEAQVHAVRKAVIAEARVIGYTDGEITRMLRINIADFFARYPRE